MRWLLLLAVIAVKVSVLYHDGLVVGTDQGFQLAGAQALLDGEGISIKVFETSDLSQQSPYYIAWWPPLFSYMAAPVLAFTNDPVFTLFFWTAFGLTSIFVGWFIILESNHDWISVPARIALWIYWLVIAPPYVQTFVMGATDFLSLGFFVLGISLAMLGLRSSPRHGLLWIAAAGALIGLSGALRYAYISVLAVLPVALLVMAILQRKPWTFAPAFICTLSTVMIFGLCMALQTGDSLSNPSGILGDQQQISQILSKIAPFPAGAFALGTTWMPGDQNTTILWLISAFVVLGCFIIAISHLVRKLRASQREWFDSEVFFYVITGLTTAGIFILLMYLSAHQSADSTWLFVQEMRYYGPVFGFLIVILFAGVFSSRALNIIPRFLIGLLIVFGAAIVSSGELKTWSFRLNSPPLGITTEAREASSPNWAFVSEIRRLREEGYTVAFLDSTQNNWYKAWAAVAGASVHHSIHQTAVSETIKITQPITLVILLSHDLSDPERPILIDLIEQNRLISLISVPDYDLYIVEAQQSAIGETTGAGPGELLHMVTIPLPLVQ